MYVRSIPWRLRMVAKLCRAVYVVKGGISNLVAICFSALLADKLGKFLIQVSQGAIKELNISYAGEVANYDVRPLTANTIKGLLSTNHGTHVNNVNARYIAERLGIKINEHKTTTAKGFTNLITVEIKSGRKYITP